MPAGSYERKMFDGGTTQASLQVGIDASQLTLTVATGQGASFPDGSSGKFVIALGRGTPTEEKILVTSRSADLFTLSTRGYDDTTGNSHLAGVTVDHVLDASTIDQANRFVNLQSSKGDIVAHDGTNAQAVSVGSDDDILVSDSGATSGVSYKSATTLGLATVSYVNTEVSAEETARISADNTLQSNIDAVAGTDIDITLTGDVTGTGTITNLGDVSFATSLAANSVGSTEIATGAVDTTELANGAVTVGKTDLTTLSVSGSSNYASASGSVKKWDNMCFVYIFAVWSGPGQTLTTLPAAYRPSSRRFIHAIEDGSGNVRGIYVESTGVITPVVAFTTPVNLTFTGYYTL